MSSPRSAKLAVVALLSVGLGACGGDDGRPGSIAADVKPLRPAVVSSRQLAAVPSNSAERAFLRAWSTMQYSAWDEALDLFDPALRSYIGPARLMEGLKREAEVFRTVRPKIIRVVRRRARVTIHFRGDPVRGETVLGSVTMRQVDRKWRLIFFSLLDDGLRSHAVQSAQIQIDPNATRVSKRAEAAGFAASQIQSQFTARQLRAANR